MAAHVRNVGFGPTFAGYLGVATIIHWDKFTAGHISFILWVILYFTLPFVLVGVWLRNRRTDPHDQDTNYRPLPKLVRIYLAVVGFLLTIPSPIMRHLENQRKDECRLTPISAG